MNFTNQHFGASYSRTRYSWEQKEGGVMSENELEGASMPTGIDVDETAAYFGIIDSSDIVHSLMSMEQSEAMEQFFSILSDIVLQPGDFDFEAASEKIQCEGGEIYYLVAGHLGLMSLPDPLSSYLGLPDSTGEMSGNTPLFHRIRKRN